MRCCKSRCRDNSEVLLHEKPFTPWRLYILVGETLKGLAGKCWCPDCFRRKKVDVQYQLSYQSGPVNRVLFLGKLIEALIKKRMNRHTDGRDMMERNQYGFCGGKSCFASLLKSLKESRSAWAGRSGWYHSLGFPKGFWWGPSTKAPEEMKLLE